MNILRAIYEVLSDWSKSARKRVSQDTITEFLYAIWLCFPLYFSFTLALLINPWLSILVVFFIPWMMFWSAVREKLESSSIQSNRKEE